MNVHRLTLGLIKSCAAVAVAMGRTKVEIDVSTLGLQTETMDIIICSDTTISNVIRKVLEKLRVQQSPKMYQLLAVPDEFGRASMHVSCT